MKSYKDNYKNLLQEAPNNNLQKSFQPTRIQDLDSTYNLFSIIERVLYELSIRFQSLS